MAKHRNRLFIMLENGELNARQLAGDLLSYLADDDCKEFAHANDIELFQEEESPEDGT